ncbi:MAG: hypothetical protein ACK5NK_02550 [Niabella sp.]
MTFQKFIFLLLTSFFFLHVAAQKQLADELKYYYRVSPFNASFSSFTRALNNDPELLNRKETKKTDTTGYFLRGDYKIFNPFSINANKVEVVFAEHSTGDTGSGKTIYTYQTLAYFDDTEANRKTVLKNYNKIKKRLKRYIPKENILSLKNVNNIEDGEIINFYFNYSNYYPVTISWQTLTKSKQIALTIITKLSVVKNYVYVSGY